MASESDGRRPDGHEVEVWAASGAMALTGRADGPGLGPPAPLVGRLRAVTARIAAASRALGRPVDVDGLALLGERAGAQGLSRAGDRSCGGATRLVRSADGWLAVTLARSDDTDLVAAWFQLDAPVVGDPWPTVVDHLRARPGAATAARAWMLGLPVAVLPSDVAPATDAWPVHATRLPGAAAPKPMAEVTVVDLSSLWAGPLCGRLLQQAGARVIKVESTARPDGSRRGPTAFFDTMNGGKLGVAVDFATREGLTMLHRLLESADVVIEASRPRALEQLGVDAAALTAGGPAVWVSITGHGRTGADRDRVAFGDDAAVAGGLVVHDDRGPCFCADAVADPLAGLVAAAACLDTRTSPGRWLLDVSMSRVAGHFAGPGLAAPTGTVAARPEPPRPTVPGPRLGEHTAAVRSDLGLTA